MIELSVVLEGVLEIFKVLYLFQGSKLKLLDQWNNLLLLFIVIPVWVLFIVLRILNIIVVVVIVFVVVVYFLFFFYKF